MTRGTESRTRPRGVPGGREVAARVVERVVRDGAYAARALDAELSRHPQLDVRERRFATELAYGALRTRGVLLERIAEHAPRGIAGGDPVVEAHLLVAAYQLLFLDRVPPFAAVDEAVGAARAARGGRVAGFVNAVLRKVARARGRVDRGDAIYRSAPEWLRQRLEAAVGPVDARALLGADGQDTEPAAADPVMVVRLRATGEAPLWAAGAEPGRVSPHARRLRKAGDPRQLEGWEEGAFVVQEEGAQVVALALAVRPGDRVLDACAGRGQKTSLLAELLGGSGELWAADLYPEKLELLQRDFARLGLPEPRTVAVDWTAGVSDVPEGFDRVLVDAPCTGTGTLRRRPEIALRLGPDDPERLAELAEQILRRAASRARPGGRVVYAVCSVLPEEGEAVVARVSDLLEPVPFDTDLVSRIAGPGVTSFRLLPRRHGTDGFFIASFRRR